MDTTEALFDAQTKYWRLRRADLFGSLSDAEVKELGAMCRVQVVERGGVVYAPGEPSDTVYYVGTGFLKLCRATEEGREVSVGVVGADGIFGALSIAGETVRVDRTVALEDSVLCGFDSGEFGDFLHRQPELALQVTRLLGQRLRDVEARIQDILFKDVRTRLAHTMAQLSVRFGEDVPEGRRISLRLTQTDLAQLIGSTRETTSTVFNEFRRDGHVATDGQYIVVHDPTSLAAY